MSPGEFIEQIVSHATEAVMAALAAEPALAHSRDPQLGSTGLHFAAHRGFRRITRALLTAGADVRAREAASDTTPLHWAAEGGHPEICGWLVERGAELEARDSWFGLTPLGWATVVDWAPQYREDRPATVQLLREVGAEDDIFSAVIRGDVAQVREMVAPRPELLARRLGFAAAGRTPLHLAVARRLATMAGLLIDLGADLGARTADGLTALALARARGDSEMAAILRVHGADEDVSSALVSEDPALLAGRLAAGVSAELCGQLLGHAAEAGLVDAIGPLLRHGAQVDARTRQLVGELPADVTALHRAAARGHVATVRALLAAGADVAGGARVGVPTPLHVAAGAGELETVRVLLAAGADRKARDAGTGATPRSWAEHGGHDEVAALLDG